MTHKLTAVIERTFDVQTLLVLKRAIEDRISTLRKNPSPGDLVRIVDETPKYLNTFTGLFLDYDTPRRAYVELSDSSFQKYRGLRRNPSRTIIISISHLEKI